MADQPGPVLRVFTGDQFRHLLAREVQRATRYQDFLSLCLARLEFPTAPSSAILNAVALRAAELLRSTDVVGLIDDVIAILLVHTPEGDAAMIMDRLRGRLEAEPLQAGPGVSSLKLVIRLGLTSFPADATADGALMAKAQMRLAAAGRSGSRSAEPS